MAIIKHLGAVKNDWRDSPVMQSLMEKDRQRALKVREEYLKKNLQTSFNISSKSNNHGKAI